jgi:hypothetical protein
MRSIYVLPTYVCLYTAPQQFEHKEGRKLVVLSVLTDIHIPTTKHRSDSCSAYSSPRPAIGATSLVGATDNQI